MKIFTKLPLYLGLGVLVLAVLISSKTISERRSLSNAPRASVAGALLSLQNDNQGKVSVLLTSEKEIAGVDVVIKYDAARVKVLPSTLRSSDPFITSGGVVENGTFSFSAVVREGQIVKSGVVATFDVEGDGLSSLVLEKGEGMTAVIDKTGSNILQ